MNLRSILTLADVPPKLRYASFVGLGVFAGLGFYVAHISRATSYLSDKPETCINCHVMKPYYASWQHSSHANAATCTDCHVPHDSLVSKYAYKAKDGARHSTIFTLRKEPQVLRATAEAREVIQANCIRCHTQLVSELPGVTAHSTDRSCVECHREVPHGRAGSLSSSPNALTPGLPRSGFDSFKNPHSPEKKQ
ncbi:MAG: cytochrome c nitrite reductase small subunit [Fimbriimonadaceae bacterium]|jgi:cytochrome c nitrite reductase small subunit|nr:cytochrome c nitrite reductase small subunit [Fimbriimonadaceae bacterium]